MALRWNPMKRQLIVAVLAALFGAPVAVAQEKKSEPAVKLPPVLQKIRESGVVTIAHRPDAMPFAYLDNDRKPVGFGVDLCLQIVEQIKKELKRPDLKTAWISVSATTRFPVIRDGKADIECGNTINNPERRNAAGYSMPYFFTGPMILTKASSGIKDLIDLRNKKFTVVTGTNSMPIMRKHIESKFLGNAQLLEVKTYDEAFDMVQDGRADAFITIEPLLYGQRTRAKDPKQYQVVGGYLILEAVAALIRRDDPEFKKFVDKQLATIMLDGTYMKLWNKWMNSPIPPHGTVLSMPLNGIMRDQLRWPLDRTGDELMAAVK
jgi:glutamate/aspartate transport system substrate-binding protein